MASYTCPSCDTDAEPAAQIGAIAVCGSCGASLVLDDTGVRLATAADTTTLPAADLQTLRKARGQIKRTKTR
jgi:hypothetical protein